MNGLLEISTLGGLSIKLDGKPVSGLLTRKVEALLVYLACTDRPHPRDVLAELLWEERSQSQALSNLRVALSNLRKVLEPFVEISRESVSIHPEANIWLDLSVLEGESPCSSGTTPPSSPPPESLSRLVDTVALYQGDFLSGFPIRNCPGFENWMTLQQERARLVFERRITDLINLLLAENRWLDVIKWGEYWIAHSYHPEIAYRSMMTAYFGMGDLASMSLVYQRCLAALRDELGIDPSQQTRKLYETLLRGEKPDSITSSPVIESSTQRAGHAARLILDRAHDSDARQLDMASLAMIHASRDELKLEPRDLKVLISSALYHGVDAQSWIDLSESPAEVVRSLTQIYEEYPKAKIRLKIVYTLKDLEHPDSTDLLMQIGTNDDAPEVRSEAAIGAAFRGQQQKVLEVLLPQLQAPNGSTALAAFVTVVDEFGLPKGIQSYPRLPVAVALVRKRWHTYRRLIRRQAIRCMVTGALSVAFFGSLLPVFVLWAHPAEFNENLRFISVLAWVLSGAIAGSVIGGLLGAALGFAVSLSDALTLGRKGQRWRLLSAGLAGWTYSLYLISFSLAGLLAPETGFPIFFILYLLYGFALGMAISPVIPPLGKTFNRRSQLLNAVQAVLIGNLVALPVIFLVYPQTWIFRYTQEACFIVIFMVGMAIAVNKPNLNNV